MMKHLLLSIVLISSGFALSPIATAQSNERTEQTDQSEEDWRRSQRKTGGEEREDVFDPSQSTGTGGIFPPLRPIDSLPTESRRHLSKQRAKAIAGMDSDGKIQETSYEPSERAKSDPNLAAEEEAVWEEMIEELQGSGGNTEDGSRSSDQAGDQNEQSGQSSESQQSGSQGQSGQGEDQSSAQGESQSDQSESGQGGSQEKSVMRGGSAASASDILKQMRGVPSSGPQSGGSGAEQSQQSQREGAISSGSSQGGAASESNKSGRSDQEKSEAAQAQPGTSDGAETGSESTGEQGQSGAKTPGENTSAGSQDGDGNSPQTSPSPLAAPIGGGAQVGASGSSTSASDFLKKKSGDEQQSDSNE